MKKLIMFFGLMVSYIAGISQTYNPSNGSPSNKPYSPSQATPTDSRSYYFDTGTFSWRPYASRAEILSYLNQPRYRTGQFDIVMDSAGIRYILFFRNGTGDNDLVFKYPSQTLLTQGQLSFGGTGNIGVSSGNFLIDSTNKKMTIKTTASYTKNPLPVNIPVGLDILAPLIRLGDTTLATGMQPTGIVFDNPYGEDQSSTLKYFLGPSGTREFNIWVNAWYPNRVHTKFDESLFAQWIFFDPSQFGIQSQGIGYAWDDNTGSKVTLRSDPIISGNAIKGGVITTNGLRIPDYHFSDYNQLTGQYTAKLESASGEFYLSGIKNFGMTDSTVLGVGGHSETGWSLKVINDGTNESLKFQNFGNNGSDIQKRYLRAKDNGSGPNYNIGAGIRIYNNINTIGAEDGWISNSHVFGGFSGFDWYLKTRDATGVTSEKVRVTDEGFMGIGTAAPEKILDITSTKSGVLLPRMTTTQRDIMTPSSWEIIINTDSVTSPIEIWNGGEWVSVPGSNSGSGGGGVPNWQTVLSQLGSFSADRSSRVAGHKFSLLGVNGNAFELSGNEPMQSFIDTVNSLTFTVQFKTGELQYDGPTGSAIHYLKDARFMDASSANALWGLNAGAIRAVTTNLNSLSSPYLFWNNSLTGSSIDILTAATGNHALYIDNSGKFGFNNISSPTADFDFNGKSRFRDTARLDARFSYNNNLHSTFTQYSLIDKAYLDSVIALVDGGGSGALDTLYGVLIGGNGEQTGYLRNDTMASKKIDGLNSINVTTGTDSTINVKLVNDSTLSAPYYTYSTNSAGRKQWDPKGTIPHLIGTTATPGISAGSGAGTSPTVSIAGNDMAGTITVIAGTSPTAGQAIATITFTTTLSSTARVVMCPANMAINSATVFPVVSVTGSTTTFYFNTNNVVGLSAGVSYQWNYIVVQ